jgi:hypothetical protein
VSVDASGVPRGDRGVPVVGSNVESGPRLVRGRGFTDCLAVSENVPWT